MIRDIDDRNYQAKVAETKSVSPLLQGAIDMHYTMAILKSPFVLELD